MELSRDKQLKEERQDYLNINAPGSSKHRQVTRGRGGGRPRGKWPKGVAGSGSGKKKIKQRQTLTQVLMQQGEGTYGQKHGRGPRTVRKRRTDKKVAEETLTDGFDDKTSIGMLGGFSNYSGGAEKVMYTNDEAMMEEDRSNSMDDDDAVDSDENVPETTYDELGKWRADFGVVAPHRTGTEAMEMSEEEEEEEEGEGDDSDDENGRENFEGQIVGGRRNEYESDRQEDEEEEEEEEENSDEGSSGDSLVSGDYSD